MQFPFTKDYGRALGLAPGLRAFNPREPRLERVNRSEILPGPDYLHREAGAYAVVYKCKAPDGGIVALRCMLQNPPSRAFERAAAHARFIEQTRLPYLVGMGFFENALFVETNAYPVYVMDWVDGETLAKYVEGLKGQAQGAPELKRLAVETAKMVNELRKAEVGHGDLHPDNIMVRNDSSRSLALVDYDSLYVPELAGFDMPILGMQGYAHPALFKGAPHPFNETADDFGATVITVSLLALALNLIPIRELSKECLYFTTDDFNDPATSRTFKALRACGDSKLSRAADELASECGAPQPSGTLWPRTTKLLGPEFCPDKYVPGYHQFQPLEKSQPSRTSQIISQEVGGSNGGMGRNWVGSERYNSGRSESVDDLLFRQG